MSIRAFRRLPRAERRARIQQVEDPLTRRIMEIAFIICGAEKSGMNVADYAEYITGKADECRARLEGNP